MSNYRIVASAATFEDIEPITAAIQQVPLSYSPHIGAGAWGNGNVVSVPGTRPPQPIDPPSLKWGISSAMIYTGPAPQGVNNPPGGGEWTEEKFLEALDLIDDVTVTEE